MQTQRRNAKTGRSPERMERTEREVRQPPSPPGGNGDASPLVPLWPLKAALIVLAALWIYSPVCNPTLPADWLWDDDQLLTANPIVQHRLSPDPSAPTDHLGSLMKLWFYPDGADYFPLSYTALWAQWPFFRMDPRNGGPVVPGGPAVAWPPGYHIVTVLLHIIGALSLWRLFSVMRLPGAWLGAFIFAVHPVCVESVAWVSELKNTLSLPLFLWACIHYIRFDDLVQAGEAADSRRAGFHYGSAIVLFLLAMFAKTSVVALPVLILFYAWWKRNSVTVRDVVFAAPFFAISVVLGLITIWYQHGRAIGAEKILVGGLDSRLASSGMSILWYLKLLVWPLNLLPIYTKWEVDPPKLWQFLPWLVIAALGWWFWKNRAGWGRHAIFAFGFFLLMVAPVLGFITISYMRITWAADHFIYLPMISLVGLLAAGLTTWFNRADEDQRRLITAGATVVLAALTIMSFRYAACWVNEDALWTHTLTYNENAWQAHNRLGAKNFARGHVENIEPATRIPNLGAFHHFTRSTALRPDLGETHNNLGTAYSHRAMGAAQRGDKKAADEFMRLAVEQFAEACRVTPHVPAIHVNLANSLAAAGRFDEAAGKYRELLEKEPGNPALINNYGVALYKSGKTEESIVQFRRALEIAPGMKDAQESLAVALGEKPDPTAPQPQAERPPGGPPPLNLQAPTSPTLGPAMR
ncbi:MAG: tetratricopeptide repeat protein [Planctomycetaceae bacterium]